MQTDYDNDLQSYFTNMEHLRGMFKDFVSAEKLPKRLIVFHGVGGVGKSSLLRMFRLHCKSEKIPVALASGDDAKSTLDIITRWMEDLKEDGVKFSSLTKTLESYRAVQAKVEDQAKKSQNKMADLAGKAVSKTAEAAGGMVIGAAIGSIVPGVGTAIGGVLGSAVGGMGAEALTNWLRGFLDKSAIDLLLDPAKKLTSDFLDDLAKAAEKKRMVLLLDTYEQMSALEDWVGEAAQKIHPNVLIVIAGRKLPDWQRVWHGWMMNAQVEELKPMTEEVMRELIHRYYATMRGGEPDPTQVDAIIKFARGLPMVVTSAVQLWVKYGVEDFQSVKVEIVANLVDRLMEGVPSSLIPALEAAAVVRWFDQPILRAVLNKDDVRDVYNELRRFPFVRTRIEGLALHDSVREMMDENLRVQDSERHVELHERTAVYFEKRLEKVTGEEAERLGLEKLYHRIRADEKSGIKLFQEMAEELSRYRLVNRLRVLLSDVNTYSLERENSRLWREYYWARCKHVEEHLNEALAIYESIVLKEQKDPKLKAYAYIDLGEIIARREYLALDNEGKKAKEILQNGLNQGIAVDAKLSQGLWTLGDLVRRLSGLESGIPYYERAINYYQNTGDEYTATALKQNMIIKLAYYGRLNAIQEFSRLNTQMTHVYEMWPILNMDFKEGTGIPLIWMGRYAQAEIEAKNLLNEVKAVQQFDFWGQEKRIQCFKNICFACGMQGKLHESATYFQELTQLLEDRTLERKEYWSGVVLGYYGKSLLKVGSLNEAENRLLSALEKKRKVYDLSGIPEILLFLGEVYENIAWQAKDSFVEQLAKSESYYRESASSSLIDRPYYACAALTGLIRVKHAQGDIAAITPLLAEAEQLAQQYEYNDHLASLRLTQGHLTSPPTPPLKGERSEVGALDYYKQAMIYALRYNRFLLDELLSGRPQGTPLRPIIPYCLKRGEEGKKILLALRDWWKTGVNDMGTPRPDTISPIPEGIPLLEAEKLARQREPGDGSTQKNAIEQLEAVIRQ
jgi:tetratricopeptide (TPR) repeat protein